jgi:mannosyltransferase OCH1-like enzyme
MIYQQAHTDLLLGWYIPNDWYTDLPNAYPDLQKYQELKNPRDPAEAAQQALDIALRKKLFINGTNIPLIVHQTWKDCNSPAWPERLQASVEGWLEAATGETVETFDKPRMAYIFWDDEGIRKFWSLYEPLLANIAAELPYPVERADVFRVAVLKWFGGIVSTMLLLKLYKLIFAVCRCRHEPIDSSCIMGEQYPRPHTLDR